MNLLQTDRTALFIDGANLYTASRAVGADVDYHVMLAWFRARTDVIRAFYYSAMLDTEEYTPIKPLVDWLSYNGYNVVKKVAKEYVDSAGNRRVKGNMDIELAVDMLQLSSRIDHAILFSGDGDFRRLVEAVQGAGVKVTVVSTLSGRSPMIADELRRQADQFVKLEDIIVNFSRASTRPNIPAQVSYRSSSSVRGPATADS